MLAGGQPRQERQRSERSRRYERSERSQRSRSQSVRETFQNVFRSMDEATLAEAFNVPTEIVRRIKQEDNRGTIVRCDQAEMRTLRPDEEEEEEEEEEYSRRRWRRNGIEETMCTMRIKHNVERLREADYYTKQAGRISLVNEQELPILGFLDMSAERGHLMPNAMHTPHWSMTDQRVVYALRGDMQMQIVDDNGDTIMDERVKEGDLFVIPQFYACVARAGSNGFEYITFKTCSQPMQSPMAGYISVLRAMPVDVVSNSYQISQSESLEVKTNRDPQSMLFTPTRRS